MYFPRTAHFLSLNNGMLVVPPGRLLMNAGSCNHLSWINNPLASNKCRRISTLGHLGQKWQTVENTELPSVVVIDAKPEPPPRIFFHSLGPISGFRLSVGYTRALSHQPVDEGPAGVVSSFTHDSCVLFCNMQCCDALTLLNHIYVWLRHIR